MPASTPEKRLLLFGASRGLGLATRFVWHKETRLGEADLVVLPGGFSYGDYLRAGAIARFAPAHTAIC